MNRKSILIIVTLLSVTDALVLGIFIGAKVSVFAGLACAIGAFMMPFAMISVVLRIVCAAVGWGRLASDFPAQPLAPDAKFKPAPTVGMRWRLLQMNGAIQWAADDEYLHLAPTIVLFNEMQPVSIPWVAVEIPPEPRKKHIGFAALREITAAGMKMWVPAEMVARELRVREELAAAESARRE